LFDSVAHLLEDDYFLGDGYDFIFSAGLYDYLSVRKAQLLTSRLFARLAREATLVIGNMTPKNPSSWGMEYLLDWFLIYRRPEDLPEFLAHISQPFVYEVTTEQLGVNGFIIVQKT
jgi:extracellular factor (EF) 3-hydroxypalmitic acid methyl ester biosynthesis protein